MTNHPNRSKTQAAQFRHAVRENGPGLNWRTVIQYATEMGAERVDMTGSSDGFRFPDGSKAVVTGLHSGTPTVELR